ncbi:Release factor glutamine methyltransferase [Salinivirga cyanobacteriivorans]|uniref:peptide chain release factor N(5)-glutamine methyltransferase n=1 Tax=Salinivirga cyanobacteriivorans TaxID=1307839 RepID=A0A0S2I1C8_9BACT|nr:peptide chain release factor N(5)-glutamine methyltransferase [Salinivirga cyanobacteriivorans]ALO16129.1 Release factor glutamine methyltransferase [Salinivirga cyanobacteriivorans]
MTYQSLLKTFRAALAGTYETSEIDSLFFVALEHVTGMSRTDFYLNTSKELENKQHARFKEILERLKTGEPVQYILNEAWFLERKFYVDHNVLIPRSETEEIIDIVKQYAPNARSILDIGTGSGCIAISLNLAMPANVWAMDYDAQILKIAKRNAEFNEAGVEFFRDNILNPMKNWEKPFDVIVSNPPYVKASEKDLMQKNVLDYEPDIALFVKDSNALQFYKAIKKYAKKNLSATGVIIMEINESLGTETKSLFEGAYRAVKVIKDIHNKDRFVIATHDQS